MSEPTHPLLLRDYRLVWLARFLSVSATSALVVVLGAQVYQVARTAEGMAPSEAAFLLGILGLVQFIPFALLTPVAGLIADKLDRRYVVAAATSIDLAIAIALGWANSASAVTLPLLFALAAAHGAARVFIGPSLNAIVPNVVAAEQLPRAIAFSSIAWQSASIIGPALAGLLLARDPSLPYWYGTVLLALSMLCILSIRPIKRPVMAKDPPLTLIAEGAKYVWRERFLLGCVSLDLFAVLLGGATAMLPAFAYDVLHVGDEGLGMLRAAPALGASLVAIWLSIAPIKRQVGSKMLWSVAVYGLATLVFGLSESFPLSLGMLALLGAADGISVFVRNTLIQLNTPDDKRGRVSSISGLAISASNELGEMQSGLAAALLGPVGAVALGGAGAILVTALWSVIFPELRRAKTFAPQYREPLKEPVS